MRVFESESMPFLYRKARALIAHERASWFLYGASFIESIFSPLPPDFLLAPMVVTRPQHAWRLAFWTTIASVAGAIGGYIIGGYFMELFGNSLVAFYGLETQAERFTSWLREYGAWVILICAVSPIPYKVVAIASGAVLIDPVIFIVVGLIGRGARFFVVAALCKKWGAAAEQFLLTKIIGSTRGGQVVLVFMASGAVLLGAFFFEYVLSLSPCQLCLWQRIPYYLVLGVSGLALVLFMEKLYYGVLVFSAVAFFFSTLLGGYHVGIELGFWQGFNECSGGASFATNPQDFMAQLQTAQPVDCSTPAWKLFGISLAGYNMLISLGLASFISWKLYEPKTN